MHNKYDNTNTKNLWDKLIDIIWRKGNGTDNDRQSNRALSKHILKGIYQIMATVQELKDAVAAAAATAADEKQEVVAALKVLSDEVQALKDQLASGGSIKEADLDEVLAAVKAVDVAVEDISVPSVPA